MIISMFFDSMGFLVGKRVFATVKDAVNMENIEVRPETVSAKIKRDGVYSKKVASGKIVMERAPIEKRN